MPGWTEDEEALIGSCNRDVFHPPHVNISAFSDPNQPFCDSIDYLVSSGTGRTEENEGEDADSETISPKLHINSLPPELLDMIFGLLSVPALDAARFVSKGWHTRIMSGSHILSNALSLKRDTPESTLWAAFDEAATLVATRRHLDCWRARFRHQRVRFSLAAGDGKSIDLADYCEIRSAVYCPIPNFVCIENHKSSPQSNSQPSCDPIFRKLNVYRTSTDEPVELVCQLDLPSVRGPIAIKGIQELDFGRRWRITVEAERGISLYDIKVRRGYERGESPYETANVGASDSQLDNTSIPEFPILRGQKDFQVVLQAPPDGASFDEISRNTVRFPYYDAQAGGLPSDREDFAYGEPIMGSSTNFYIAQSSTSGELNLIRHDPNRVQAQQDEREAFDLLDGDPHHGRQCHDDFPELVALATLNPPSQDAYVFRNLAAASTIVNSARGAPVVRVAVIWQVKGRHRSSHDFLYLYELPWSLAKKEPSHIGGLVGKRISSLPTDFGGIHPKSELLQSGSLLEPGDEMKDEVAALGGMHFPRRPTVSDKWSSLWCKLVIWGPSSDKLKPQRRTSLDLRIFDFSFMSVQRLAASDIPSTNMGHDGQAEEGKHRPRRTMMSRRMQNCCCVLHDEFWNVELPRMETPAPPAPPVPPPSPKPALTPARRSAFFRFLNFKSNTKPHEPAKEIPQRNGGTIWRQYSAGQRAAMARQDDWIKRWIVGLKLAGKENWEVLNLWHNASWTNWGLLPRPTGWEKEWRGWAEELGVDVGQLEKMQGK